MAEKVTLPLVPLRGIVVYPNMIMHVDVGRDSSVYALEAAMVGNRRISRGAKSRYYDGI